MAKTINTSASSFNPTDAKWAPYAHISMDILQALDDYGNAYATLEQTTTILARAYAADKLSAGDLRLCMTKTLCAHMSKYAAMIDKKTNLPYTDARGETLSKAVQRECNKIKSFGKAPASVQNVAVRVSKVEQAMWVAMQEEIAAARLKFETACGERAGVVRKTMTERARSASKAAK